MKYGILLEKISETGYPKGYFYAHIPTLGLTAHGKGIEGALISAKDLVSLWLKERKANSEEVPTPQEMFS